METKYKAIYDEIKSRIVNHAYQQNQKIPDELSLCKEFNCSRMTMKKALDLLVQEGFIYRKRGLGSFVMSNHIDSVKFTLQERELLGLTKSSQRKISSKVLEFTLLFANEKIAQILNIHPNDPIYHILRLRTINQQPYVLEKTYMSTTLIPGINLNILDNSIYDYIEHDLHYKIASAKKTTRADISNELDHKYLKLKENEPVLEIEQIAYLDNGVPFEYSFSRHRYDLFEFTTYSVRR